MKLGTLYRAQHGIGLAYRLNLKKDGLRAYKLRKELAALESELKIFGSIVDDAIKATGKTEITENDPDFIKVNEIINEAGKADIPDPTPYIKESDLEGVDASAAEIDAIIKLGLLKEADESPASGPATPGPAPAIANSVPRT